MKADGKGYKLAFGIERIGLISLRYPFLVTAILLVLSIAAAVGIARIRIDNSLSQLFRSDTPQFRTYEYVTRRFPSSEFDVLIAVTGRNLLGRDELAKLRDAVTDLQLIDGVRGLISLFSARQPPRPAICRRRCFPRNCRRAPTTSSWSNASDRTRSSRASCCPPTAGWRWWFSRSSRRRSAATP